MLRCADLVPQFRADRGRRCLGSVCARGVATVNRWLRFEREWNAVLLVLAVLALGIVLAMVHWWLGLAFVVACVVAFVVLLYD